MALLEGKPILSSPSIAGKVDVPEPFANDINVCSNITNMFKDNETYSYKYIFLLLHQDFKHYILSTIITLTAWLFCEKDAKVQE